MSGKPPEERTAAALRIAVERSGARGGFLYLGHSGTSLRLVSQLPEDEEPPSGFTDRLASIMTIASGQTLDEDDETVTGGPELDAGSGKLHTELLVVSQVSGPLVVGALVPDRGAGESLVPLHREIVLAIAEACA